MLKQRTHPAHILLLISVVFCVAPQAGRAQLSVHTTAYGTKPGYIESATLLVEPHGAYTEQSLYLFYGDRNQYPGSKLVEIVHRFRLPANAVVNDMWLWIGDSIMQAIMLNTWKARAIYDSITSGLHDPAFLSKVGDVYELRIFPLVSGSIRRVKLNFITPTQWLSDAVAELPWRMLMDNNAAVRPVDILFREPQPLWGTPFIKEKPAVPFVTLKDTLGYRYRYAHLDDVSSLNGLSLIYQAEFSNASFFASSKPAFDTTYFQFGVDPGGAFAISPDSSRKNILFAIDLSGDHNKRFSTLIPKLKQVIRAAVKPSDSCRILIAGASRVASLKDQWTPARPDSINAMIDRFAASEWGRSIDSVYRVRLCIADEYASTCWGFSGLSALADVHTSSSLVSALGILSGEDVLATYAHGKEHLGLTNASVNAVKVAVDSFLLRGGRVLTYFDGNRTSAEAVAVPHIKGLKAVHYEERDYALFAVPEGNISAFFPASFHHYMFNYLAWDADPDVRAEVVDAQGHPCVISKRIGAGLLVVSAIWSFRDDAATVRALAMPLLGLNAYSRGSQVIQLLDSIRTLHKRSPADRVIFFSNSDTVFDKPSSQAYAAVYESTYGGTMPPFWTINLLDASEYLPMTISENLVDYYGCGYLMKSVASRSRGRHYETHLYPWNTLCAMLDPYSLPRADSFSVAAVVHGGNGQLNEMREVDPVPQDPNKARFFIGRCAIADSITFTLRAVFNDGQGERFAYRTGYITNDTSYRSDRLIPAMLGNEHLRDMYRQAKLDTAGIVGAALRHRLLCDFTALLALEPNDTLHFMRDAFDETRLLEVPDAAAPGALDSVALDAAPNPFRLRNDIVCRVNVPSHVTIGVYDLLGRLVRVLAADEPLTGSRHYSWDGLDGAGRRVSAGAYMLQLVAREEGSGALRTAIRSVVLQ